MTAVAEPVATVSPLVAAPTLTLSALLAQAEQKRTNEQTAATQKLNRFAKTAGTIIEETFGAVWVQDLDAHAKQPTAQAASDGSVTFRVEVARPDLYPFFIQCEVKPVTPSTWIGVDGEPSGNDWYCRSVDLLVEYENNKGSYKTCGILLPIYEGKQLIAGNNTNEETLAQFFLAIRDIRIEHDQRTARQGFLSAVKSLANAATQHGKFMEPVQARSEAARLRREFRSVDHKLDDGRTLDTLVEAAIKRHDEYVAANARRRIEEAEHQQREQERVAALTSFRSEVDTWMRQVCEIHGRNLERCRQVQKEIDSKLHAIYELTYGMVARDEDGDQVVDTSYYFLANDTPDAEGYYSVLTKSGTLRRMKFPNLVSIEALPPAPESKLGHGKFLLSFYGLYRNSSGLTGVLLPSRPGYEGCVEFAAAFTSFDQVEQMLIGTGLEHAPTPPTFPHINGENQVFLDTCARVVKEFEAKWRGEEYTAPDPAPVSSENDFGVDDPFAE